MAKTGTPKSWVSAREIAQAARLSYAAVNNYTDMGLLEVVGKHKRVRMYEREKSLERMGTILRLLSEGYTLRVIVKLLKK